MSLYKITKDNLEIVPRTTFATEQILERNDLQRFLKQDISPIGDDLMVIAEEYGEWENANRRIDLLCINQRADIVVVEIKRTEDGGHMDLQAIRYAAMVSSMTLDQAIHTYARTNGQEEDEARSDVLSFLQSGTTSELELTGEVRVILVSADFSVEVATAVLWLNRKGLDITCIRLRPYKIGDEVLIDATQIIPLPEAADYEVKLRTQESEQKRASHRWQEELYRFWTHMIQRNQNKFPFLASRSAPKTPIFNFKKGNGYTMRLDVLKETSYFNCEIKLSKDDQASRATVSFLIGKRKSIEEAFGSELKWKEEPNKSVYFIYQTIDGGWSSPEAEWPTIQDRLLENLQRLEKVLQEPIEELRRLK